MTGPDDEPDAGELTDELDLHAFLPRECADVVEEYVRAAQEAGLALVRIIHGKGTGTLRRIVHAVLDRLSATPRVAARPGEAGAFDRHPVVRSYRLAGGDRGSWGATLVELVPRAGPPRSS